MIVYNKFLQTMEKQGLKQSDLRKAGIHPRIFYKLKNNELIRTDTINDLCALLHCQPGDLMEYIPDEKPEK